ncbi:hypothetical protein K469DRAFT_361573 [Zopfia rhizophila CBS 207.26]|uniref:Uncharacterized protein n=1 Tax=Zopfia rhizophila CBS 207.26 TaxID=1314779 RepID=A0A6A6EIT7_9PEZI|nr:hypothetical protein K469DRAFT_361573 [Zopfia rhizophila CBS 207.26]
MSSCKFREKIRTELIASSDYSLNNTITFKKLNTAGITSSSSASPNQIYTFLACWNISPIICTWVAFSASSAWLRQIASIHRYRGLCVFRNWRRRTFTLGVILTNEGWLLQRILCTNTALPQLYETVS